MPDIDHLSVVITSSSKPAIDAVDKVIGALAKLNAALDNYSDGSGYVKGMSSLAGGLRDVSSAINSIDIEKIKNLSSALGSLGTAGEKLARLNYAKSFAEMGSELQRVNSAASVTARQITSIFDIPRSYNKSLTDAVKALYQSGNNETAFKKAEEDIRNIVRESQSAKKNLSETYQSIRKYLSTSKMYIPKQVMQDWGDDAKSKRATIGVNNTTTKLGEGTSMEVMAEEMKRLGATSIDTEHGITACANSIVKFLEEEKKAATVHTDFTPLAEIFDKIRDSVYGATQAINAMSTAAKASDDEFYASSKGSTDFFDIQEESSRAQQAINNVTAAVDTLRSDAAVEIANPFQGLMEGLEGLKDIEVPAEKFAGLTNMATSLSKLGGKNATAAIKNMPALGKAFAQMVAELNKSPQITERLVRLAEAMSKFSKSTTQATTSSNTFATAFRRNFSNALTSAITPARKAHGSLTSLAAVFGTLYANFFLLIRAARLLSKAMDYSSSMTEAQNVVSVVFGKQSKVMDDFAQTAIKDFGLARLAATQYASRFQAMGSAMGLTAEQVGQANDFITAKVKGNERAYKDLGSSVADMSINITKLTADMASLFNQDYDDVAADMQAIYTGMTRPLRKYGLDLTQATLKEWALANGLDADIEKMSQAEKTMLRYQYVMSRAAGAMGDFQKTQDTWANSLRTVKQLLQEIARTVGEALINALRPALVAFKNFLFNFLSLAESALNALGKLLGWKQIDFGGAALVEETEDYADALDDAAGAAKKLKGQLRGIDELNNLTTNKGGGGGGGGTSAIGAGIESIWDQIKETEKMYESTIESWYDFGRKISDKVKEGLQSIDWDTIFEKVTNFGKNLASFLNGLIDPETWKLFGKTLADGVRTAIKFAFSFGDEFDFENLGEAIAEGINGFFEEFDGGELGKALDVWIQGLKKAFTTAVGEIKWKEIFADLYNFLDNISIDSIGFTFGAGTTILGLTALTTLIASTLAENPIFIASIGISIGAGYLVGNKLNDILRDAIGDSYDQAWFDLFDVLHVDDLIKAVQKKAGEKTKGVKRDEKYAPKNGFDAVLGPRETESGRWNGGGNIGRRTDLHQKSWAQLFYEELRKPEENVATGEDYLDFYFGWIKDSTFLQDFFNSNSKIGDVFNGNIIKSIMGDDLEKQFNDMQKLEDAFKHVTESMDNMALSSKGLSDLPGLFDSLASSVGTDFGEMGSKISEWYENDVKPKFDINEWLAMASNIKTSIGDKWRETSEEWKTNITTWWDSDVYPWFTYEKWAGIFQNIYNALEDKWNDTTSFWLTDITSFINNQVAPWFTEEKWKGIFGGIEDAIKSVLGGAKDFAKGFFNSLADFAEQFINGAIDGFSALASAKSLLSDSPINFNIGHISIPRFAKGGFPELGSLFIAGEAGSEMVGNINGRTGVVSNGEITGIADAIRASSEVEISLLRQQNSLLQGILEKEFGISKDDIFKSVRTSAREYTYKTGNSAFI